MRRAPTRQCNRFFGAALLYTRGVFRYERSSMADPTIAHPGMALAETETKDPTIAHPEGERKAAAKQGQRARAGADKRPWERKGESESDLDCKAAKKQRTADIVRRCQKLISDIRVLRERGKHDERDIKATAQELISIYQDTITLAQS